MEIQQSYFPGAPSLPTPGMVISSRASPPAHFCWRIESLKLLSDSLSKCGTEKHESDSFEASGFRWKLSLYPRGDTKRNGKGHISLYLVLEGKDPCVGLPVRAICKLFLYDHIRGNYLIIERDYTGPIKFNKLKSECAYPRFIPLSILNNSLSGFKEGDSCVFGAEVYVTDTKQRIAKEVCLSNGAPPCQTFSNVVDLSELVNCEYYDCSSFQARGRKWFIRLRKHTSPEGIVYLHYALVLSDVARTPPRSSILTLLSRRSSRIGAVTEQAVFVTGTVSIQDQLHGKHIERKFGEIYRCSKNGGFQKLVKMDHLNDASRGYVASGKMKVGVCLSGILATRDYLT